MREEYSLKGTPIKQDPTSPFKLEHNSARKMLDVKTKTDAFDTSSMISMVSPGIVRKHDSTLKSGIESSAHGGSMAQTRIFHS